MLVVNSEGSSRSTMCWIRNWLLLLRTLPAEVYSYDKVVVIQASTLHLSTENVSRLSHTAPSCAHKEFDRNDSPVTEGIY